MALPGSKRLFLGPEAAATAAAAGLLVGALTDSSLDANRRQAKVLLIVESNGGRVPPALRWCVWPVLLGAHQLLGAVPLATAASAAVRKAIRDRRPSFVGARSVVLRDVPRTAPQLRILAREGRTRTGSALRRVLEMLAALDVDVRYVQSLNFVAVQLLIAGVRVEAALACMVALTRSKGCGLAGLYLEGLDQTRALSRAVLRLAEVRFPGCAGVVACMGPAADGVVVPWLMALGGASSLPWSSKLVTMDSAAVEVARSQVAAARPPRPDGLPRWLDDRMAELLTREVAEMRGAETAGRPAGPGGAGAAQAARAPGPTTSACPPRLPPRPPLTAIAGALTALRAAEPWMRASHRRAAGRGERLMEAGFSLMQQSWLEDLRRTAQAPGPAAHGLAATPGPASKVLRRQKRARPRGAALAPLSAGVEAPGAGPAPGGPGRRRLSSASSEDSDGSARGGAFADAEVAFPGFHPALAEPRRAYAFSATSEDETGPRLLGPALRAVKEAARAAAVDGSVGAVRAVASEMTLVDGQLCFGWMHPGRWGGMLRREVAWLGERPVRGGATRLDVAFRTACSDIKVEVPAWCE